MDTPSDPLPCRSGPALAQRAGRGGAVIALDGGGYALKVLGDQPGKPRGRMPGITAVDTTRPFAWIRSRPSKAPGLALVAAMLSCIVPSPAHAGDDAFPAPEGEIVLTVTGRIARGNDASGAVFDEAMLAALPSASLETTTVVTDGVRQFDGFLMRDLLALVEADGETVRATALNDYVIDIPMQDFERFDVLVATHMDGRRLLPSDKGPFWIVYPRDDHAELQDIRYDYRWVWQLVRLQVE